MLDIYQLAFDNQNGVNATALLGYLNDSLPVMWAEAHVLRRGTEYVNTHPVMIVLVDRLACAAHPARSAIYKDWHAAVRVCQERAGTGYSERLVAEATARSAGQTSAATAPPPTL